MSDDVERYFENVHGDGGLFAHPKGVWCRYEHIVERDAEIERLRAELADSKRLLQQIAMWIDHPVPHDILVENCEACRRLEIIHTAIGEES